MNKKARYLGLLLMGFLVPALAWAFPIEEGKHYTRLDTVLISPALEPGKDTVMEYFSFACVACSLLEPHAQSFEKTKTKQTRFIKIPVAYQNREQENLSKAYYVAKHFNVDLSFSLALFETIQKSKKLPSQEVLVALLVKEGLKKSEVESAFQSLSLEIQLKADGENLVKGKIFEIPTLIVNNQYKITPSSAGGLEHMFQVAQALIVKLKKN